MDSADEFVGVVPQPPRDGASSRAMPDWFRKHRVATRKLPPSLQATASLIASAKPGGNAPANVTEEYKVDHHNTPYRWKDKVTLEKEKTNKQDRSRRRKLNSVKKFPGDLRKSKLALAQEAQLEKELQAQAARAAIGIPEFDVTSSELSQTQPMPADSSNVPLDDADYLQIDQSKLPLDQFDSVEFETRTPQEWIETGSKASSPFWTNGVWQWVSCTVLSYDSATQLYKVKYDKYGKTKDVSRIHLRFGLEEQPTFDARIKYARSGRENAKSRLRFDHYVLQQPNKDVKPMQPATLQGIHDKVILGLPPAMQTIREGTSQGNLLRALTTDVIQNYTHCMKKAVLFHTLSNSDEKLEQYSKLRLPPPPTAEEYPMYGKVSIPEPEVAYEDKHLTIVHSHYTRHDEVRDTLTWMADRWHYQFVDSIFMDIGLQEMELPCAMEHFEKLQSAHAARLEERLATDWHRGISEHLIDKVQDLYDFFQTDLDAFMESDLCCLLKAIELRMASHLRHVACNSIEQWLAFVKKYSKECLPVETEAHKKQKAEVAAELAAQKAKEESIQEERAAAQKKGSKAVKEFEAKQKKIEDEEAAKDALKDVPDRIGPLPAVFPILGTTPLFDVQLVVAQGRAHLQPSKEQIEQSLLKVFSRMSSAVQGYSVINAGLMSLLSLDTVQIFNLDKGDALEAPYDKLLNDARAEISQMVTDSMKGAEALGKLYDSYAYITKVNTEEFVSTFANRKPEPTLREWENQILEMYKISEEVQTLAYDEQLFSMTRVDCTGIKNQLSSKAKEIITALMDHMVRNAHDQNQSVVDRYQAIEARINEKPKNEMELQALKDFMEDSKVTIDNMKDEVDEIHGRLGMLDQFCNRLSEEDFTLAWSTKEWPRLIDKSMLDVEISLEADKVKMMDALALEKEQFNLTLEQIEKDVEAFKEYGDADQVRKHAEAANFLMDDIQNSKDQGEDFNNREKVFGFPPTEYALLDMLQSNFEPYFNLWNMLSDFEESKKVWLGGPFVELNADAIDADVMKWWKTSYKLSKQLGDESPSSAEVAQELRERTTTFKQFLPVIKSLASPALRERHWGDLSTKIGEKLGREVNISADDEELTLQQLLDMKLQDEMELIQSVCVAAEKEYSLEKALQAMIAEWEPVEFEVLAYKETGTHLIRGVDDIVTLLDDHLVKVQTMRGSPFIKPIEMECKRWEKKLQYSQQLLDEWAGCQQTWLYLEPIFGSDDIMRQMPTEARRFASVDALWRKNMADTVDEPRFMASAERDGLLKKFVQANQKLDEIQKGLNDYLETKRLYFPRFFFLSNDELLEILSQTKEPRAVQPHLGKCFEGCNKCKFEKDLKITEMISSEGEVVALKDPVDPETRVNKGNVEMWLLELEANMWGAIRDSTARSMLDYANTERTQWTHNWPAQVILGVSQVYWTRDVTKHILDERGGPVALAEFVEELNQQLINIVMLVRGGLSKMMRKTIGALVVIDVHARDTILSMIQKGVNNVTDFEWMSQLRYYWEPDPDTGKGDDMLLARIVNATIKYGYEYLGNSMRLVITPLTDRCYRTMMGAVGLGYGGAPEGPAGTGKTETVKDLAKAVAIQCVVFNCSDGLDYLAMAKFFKGLAGCGSWCCFDEFNRINIEVLSVIAQQILTINEAKKAGVEKFHFEGTYIKLNQNCNVYITMNPGYAGRAELPDNLKALFRPCAMMVPDYALIGEIRLYSFGFTDARSNAQKLVQVLQLSSEQLSSQKHYDYGMRAVNSILVAAGNLRQQLGNDPFWTEPKIVLRSVNDVNLPKFMQQDLPLFKGITADLFPGIELPAPDHGDLIPTIDEACKMGIWIKNGLTDTSENPKKTLQPVAAFSYKCIQLYEMILVRHGLMLVGETYGCKTSVLYVLAKAMTLCNERGNEHTEKIQIFTMNPKSITSGQLYGNFDDNTHEWSDGVLACTYRDAAKDPSPDRKWVMFDGPVDAVWIENMNTVLDDNKKLCLMSGEIVKMSDVMTMMFETEDLQEASPATVSRVGIVFVEPQNFGWGILLDSWLDQELSMLGWAPDSLTPHREYIRGLFDWLVDPLLYFVEKRCVKPVPITFMELAASAIRLFHCLLDIPEGMGSDHHKALDGLFLQTLTWSVGACVNPAGRDKFDEYLKRLVANNLDDSAEWKDFLKKNPDYVVEEGRVSKVDIPSDLTVYDYDFDPKKMSWATWMSLAKKFVIPKGAPFSSILVPTVDTERNNFLTDTLLTHGMHMLCSGDTGTGKSASINRKLLNDMGDKYKPYFLNFSAQTSANQTQDIIDSKMDKRRKGVLGPPLGQVAIIFVDDLNMPQKEIYGAQPPIEILRQWMDHGGWYDRKENAFRQLVDIQFITAMGPPGGGRNHITQRYIRHFNLVNFVPFSNDMLTMVFSTILDWFLAPFPSGVKSVSAPMVAATIDMYNTISTSLLPTPAKSHYTFNLRDLSKVIQGVLQGHKDSLKAAPDLIRLWSHESMRVFCDRLIDDADRTWFKKELEVKVKEHFKLEYKKVRGANDVLIYGNFSDAKNLQKPYVELEDHAALRIVCDEYLDDYNQITSAPMALVLFMNAIEHVARISRVLNQPQGNALLVGVGGSGRKSMCILATHIADFELFQIEISKTYGKVEWHDDLKRVLMMTGVEEKPTSFMFSDTQIVNEGFVEDINGILNTGEVANLFNQEELAAITEGVGARAQEAGVNTGSQSEVYKFFVEECRNNLHVVLAFSPIGDAFRTRLRMFPSLVNCCTIDWFTAWPEEALSSVANYFLHSVEMDQSAKDGVMAVCVLMQKRTQAMTTQFLKKQGRYYYVTPTSYLALINTFRNLLDTKRSEILEAKGRYDNGLTKLIDTADQVESMQEELEALQPKLKEATIATDELIVTIGVQQKEADSKKIFVQKEEALCNAQAAEANELKTSCESELAEAIPALENAVKALKTLSKGDIVEVKAMKKPPPGVKVTMEAVCLMMGVKPDKIKDPEGGTKKVEDYWGPACKQLLSDSNFLKHLQDYDKDNMTPAIIEKVTPFTQRDDFTPDIVAKASKAAAGLCKWVHAMVIYNRVAKVVAPKKAALKTAIETLEAATAALNEKRALLKEVEDKVAELQKGLDAANAKKVDLQNQVDDCSKKLVRAEQLIGGLGGERSRWTQLSAELQQTYENVVGDIMLSAGVIAYMGAFPLAYRAEAIADWSKLLKDKGITCADDFSLASTLGEPVKIRAWTIDKLPNDSFSIENAIMLFKSQSWPLMIDPQGQANRWVKNMESSNSLKVVKQTSNTFVRTIENAIQFGHPVLLENAPEVLDPVLESVLLKQVVTQGGVSTIRLGDNTVEYDPKFRFYITTKMSNPHYPPETCVKVNLLNFMATQDGLEDQMLGIAVAKEQEELEKKRVQLVIEDAENKKQLKEIEDTILKLLKEAEGNILDDEVLIDTLSESKVTSVMIEEKVKEADKMVVIIANTRKSYVPVAYRASQLFFCIADLAGVDPMYQYSLEWFINLFIISIEKAEKSNILEERLKHLNDSFTYTLYVNVCRSLFEKDKLLFSFLLTAKILLGEKKMSPAMLRFFLQGNTAMDLEQPNPLHDGWLSDKNWGEILALSKQKGFKNFDKEFTANLTKYEKAYTSSDPATVLDEILNDPEYERYDEFARLNLLRCLRPDSVIPIVMKYVKNQIGQRFIEPPPFNLMAGYVDSNCATPLIFVLTPGAAPMSELLVLAEELGFTKKLSAISLGQGQGPLAEKAIDEAVDKGTWVCLQNCHLCVSWMPTLEKTCEEISPERAHVDFRLWLTSEPSKAFPQFVLQNGVKMTNEPPKGMRANMMGNYHAFTDDWFESCGKPAEFKKMVFGLCFFHATVRERKKFGPLGWNIQYVFSTPDLGISRDQLKIFLDDLQEGEAVPYEALHYLVGECNYGGRVTDDKDRRCISNILTDFYCAQIQDDDYKFSDSGTYFVPPETNVEGYMDYIKTLPFNDAPEVFGFHENANITSAIAETNLLLSVALSLQEKTSGGEGMSWEDTLSALASDIDHRVPDLFDNEKAGIDFPVTYSESMNTVLTQELIRFNTLIERVHRTLKEVQKAVSGLVVMSGELEAMGNSMVNGSVPDLWSAVSYPSLKPLGSWVLDFLARLVFLQDWFDSCKTPEQYWISGFFFTQAFITGTKQNFARKYQTPIDQVNYDMKVLSFAEGASITQKPEDGAYVDGLFIEGCYWDDDLHALAESEPKVLYTPVPHIWLVPKENKNIEPVEDDVPGGTCHVYQCPIYKTSFRQGTLSTTGHSTNFVMMIRVPMQSQHKQKHWIKRGVAMLTQLDD